MVNINPFSNKIKYLKDDGRPKTLIRTGTAGAGGVSSTAERNVKDLKQFWLYYKGEGTVFASINVTTWNTVMTGYSIEGEDNEAVKYIQSLCDDIGLEDALLDAVLYTLIFGDGFIEKVRYKNGDVARLKVVDTRTMFIEYDNYGDVKGFYQEIGGRKTGKTVKPEDIIHIRFFPFPNNPYGLSIIEPNRDTIDRKVDTDVSLYNAIKRHGTSKWIATVGTEKDGQIPPDSVMDDIKVKLEDIQSKNEFVVPWMIKLETIDEGGIEGVEEYSNYFQTQLVIGLLCPEEALGLGKGSTEATARIKAIMYERMIKSFQYKISNIIRKDLFNEHLIRHEFTEEVEGEEDRAISVRIKFDSVTEEDEALRAKWLGNLLRGFKDGDIPFTKNEIRGFFGLAPREDMEKLIDEDKKPETDEEQETIDEENVDEEEEEEEDEEV